MGDLVIENQTGRNNLWNYLVLYFIFIYFKNEYKGLYMKQVICSIFLTMMLFGCNNNQVNVTEELKAANLPSTSSTNIKSNIEHLNKIVKANPEDYATKIQLGIELFQLGGRDNFEKSRSIFEEVSAKSSDINGKKVADRFLKQMKDTPEKFLKTPEERKK
jgi:hypothetical protein